MKALKENLNRAVVGDSIDGEIRKLRLVYTFLTQISDIAHEEKANFIGRWNIRYFEAAILTLGESIDSLEEIV